MVGHFADRMLAQLSGSDHVVTGACTQYARSQQLDETNAYIRGWMSGEFLRRRSREENVS
jgi:curli biogenesis system outer membrane secretion channel CsgG